MSRIPLRSSNLASVGYDPRAHVLEVEFHNGSLYQYFGVPPARFEGLMKADSKGGYHAQNIKQSYRYSRIH